MELEFTDTERSSWYEIAGDDNDDVITIEIIYPLPIGDLL